MKIPKHDLRCAAAPLQVAMWGRNLQCACEIQFGKMCDVHACSAFSGVRSVITILQVSLQSLNKSGPDSLIFFNLFFFRALKGGPKSQKLDLCIRNLNAFQPNNEKNSKNYT